MSSKVTRAQIDDLKFVVPVVAATILILTGCSQSVESPPAISLVKDFAAAEVSDSPIQLLDFPDLTWRFNGESKRRDFDQGHVDR